MEFPVRSNYSHYILGSRGIRGGVRENSCILGSKVQDSTWIPQVKLSKIPDSTSRNFPVSEIRIPLLGAIPLHVLYCCAAVMC